MACPECGGAGWFRSEEHPGKLEPCRCTLRINAHRLQDRIGSHLNLFEFADIRQNTPSAKSMVVYAMKFVGDPFGYLTIWGGNGCGKSMTLQAIATRLIYDSVPTIYITMKRLVDWLKDGINDDYDVAMRIDRISTIDVLCLDELAAIVWTDWVTEQVTAILQNRYDEHGSLGTVLAMDEDPKLVLPMRLYSRISEYPIIHNIDPDFRLAIGRAK